MHDIREEALCAVLKEAIRVSDVLQLDIQPETYTVHVPPWAQEENTRLLQRVKLLVSVALAISEED